MQCILHLIVTLWVKQGTLHSWWKRAMLWGHSIFFCSFLCFVLSEVSRNIACSHLLPQFGTKACFVSILIFFYSFQLPAIQIIPPGAHVIMSTDSKLSPEIKSKWACQLNQNMSV